MWIKFVSDGTATGQGFRATFVSANLQAPYFLISGNHGYRRNVIYRLDVETATYYALPLNISEGYVDDLDFDPVEQTIYWSQGYYDAHIYASFINGSGKRTIPIPGSSLYCLTVDPLSRLIFYCDYARQSISMMTMKTMATKTFNSSVSWRNDIALNTAEGVMFWTQYSPHYTIERANYDGTDRRTVVNESSYIHAIALDVSKNRLYWMTVYTYRLKMSDLEGKDQITVFTFYESLYYSYFERVLLFNTTFYFSHNSGYRTARLFSWDIGSANYTVVADVPFNVYSLYVVQPGLSSDIELNGCGTNNGGCDSICMPLPNNGSKCLCPDGQTLTRNLTSCVDVCPENYWGTNCSQTCNCSERATCYVLEGCVCNRGWSGVTCSTDVNECETMTNACGQNQICQNNPGSFVCLCPDGFLKVGDKCVAAVQSQGKDKV